MNYDDVDDAIREGRALREASAYRIRFALEGLTFRNIDVPDPVPTGRQILSSAGLDHRADYILYAYLDTRRQPILVQEAKYLPPYHSGVTPYLLTGEQHIYAGEVERELIYHCTLEGVAP